MKVRRTVTYVMTAALAFAMCGLPETMQAQQATTQSSTTIRQQQAPTSEGITVDPSKGPLTPPPPSEPQPTTEMMQPLASPTTTTLSVPEAPQQQGQHEPLGTAAAGGIATEGGSASRPAGTAIAPAQQHQVRSLLIKLGAIAAAGAAIGTVYALSKGTPSTPPGR